MPKFQSKEEYERWKAARDQGGPAASSPGSPPGYLRPSESAGSGASPAAGSKKRVWVWVVVAIAGIAALVFFSGLGKKIFGKNIPPNGIPSDWQEFSSSAGNFSVQLPGTPGEQEQTAKSQMGNVETHAFSLMMPDKTTYLVTYTDLPAAAQQLPVDKLLDQQFEQAVGILRGQQMGVSTQQVALGSYTGRELTLNLPNTGSTIMRIFVVQGRIYQFMVVAPTGMVGTTDHMRFMNSFRLLSP